MWRRLLILVLLLVGASCDYSAPSTVAKIKSLRLNIIPGTIKAYHSPGAEKRTLAATNLLQHAIPFFQKQLGVTESFSIALLDSARWTQVSPLPYGLPFVSGPPYIVCLPSTSDNVLAKIVTEAVDGYPIDDNSLSKKESIAHFISLIGLHELGHIYANEYGASFPNKWTYEFIATYFAYLYLEHNSPEESKLWVSISDILLKEINPQHTSLADFETLYAKVGVQNYAWYQVAILQRVKEVYEQQGIKFLITYKDYQWSAKSPLYYLEAMEQMAPGFLKWAEKYHLN